LRGALPEIADRISITPAKKTSAPRQSIIRRDDGHFAVENATKPILKIILNDTG
jgi:hypothetical protein